MNYQNSYRPNSFNLLPPVVKNLLIINGLFFLATEVIKNQFGIDLADKLGLHYPLSQKFQPYQAITYLFMHANFRHLFLNMFALWMFGNALENLWGPKRFLIYYIITGIGAAFCHYAIVYFQNQAALDFINNYIANPSLEDFKFFLNSDYLKVSSQDIIDHYNSVIPTSFNNAINQNNTPEALQISVDYMRVYKIDFLNGPVIIGASGAVFGILLAFGMLFPNRELYLYMAIPVKAKWFVLGYGVIELISGLYGATGDNVAHFAHLGGMLFGFILLKYWQRNSKTFY